MTMAPRAWTIAAGAGLLLIALAAAGLFDGRKPTGDPLGVLRSRTPEITGDMRIGERFPMQVPSLTAITIHPVAVGPPRGDIQLELMAIGSEGEALVRSGVVAASDMTHGDTYEFTFPPIADSRRRVYRLDISSSRTAPSSGVALWATRGPRLENAFLSFNGINRVGSLAFQTRVAGPPPRPRVQIGVALAALAASWCAALAVLRWGPLI
jgi:hypothetical protein